REHGEARLLLPAAPGARPRGVPALLARAPRPAGALAARRAPDDAPLRAEPHARGPRERRDPRPAPVAPGVRRDHPGLVRLARGDRLLLGGGARGRKAPARGRADLHRPRALVGVPDRGARNLLMHFGLTDERKLLQATLRDFAARGLPPGERRRLFEA